METDADKTTTTMQELLPFCRELLLSGGGQRPSRAMLKIYLLGSAVAVLGSVLGLAEAVCHAFSTATGGGGDDDDELADAEMTLLLLAAGERRRALQDEEMERRRRREEVEEEKAAAAASVADHVVAQSAKTHQQQAVRTLATRQHAS